MTPELFVPHETPQGWTAATFLLRNPADKLLLRSMRLPEDTPITGLTKDAATELAARINLWLKQSRRK